jgi:hypothetical protein
LLPTQGNEWEAKCPGYEVAVNQDVFAVSEWKILRTIQKTRFESLKLKPFDKKYFSLLIFAQKQTFN